MFSSTKTRAVILISMLAVAACSTNNSPTSQQLPGDPTSPPGVVDPQPQDPNNPPDPSSPASPAEPSRPVDPAAPINPISNVGQAKLLTHPDYDAQSFFDGPAYQGGVLYFSDYDRSQVLSYKAGAPQPFALERLTGPDFRPIGSTVATNELLTVEVSFTGPARLVRNLPGAPATPVVTDAAWDAPNDVVLRPSDGLLFVSDPGYQAAGGFLNRVFSVGVDGVSKTVATFNNAERPNGIALSADEKTLYLSLTATGQILKYPVNADGTLGQQSEFLSLGDASPDGLLVDKSGNLYVATNIGVQVFSSTGTKWGVINTPKQTTACAFGGADDKTLFVTAVGAVYQVDGLKVAGLRQ